MARQLEATMETQLDAVAAALTIIYSDTVLTGVAADLRDPRHPLRDFHGLLAFNATTGVYTTNTVALGEAYANNRPNTSQSEKDDRRTALPV